MRTPLCPAGHLPLKGGDRDGVYVGSPQQTFLQVRRWLFEETKNRNVDLPP
ncbi:hypothetical protein GGR23_001541 [Gellertiella hungarica]|uniref:Lytic murein transglycosylase n=1 Tax=Gellertiella hungarica TaxID=1572859 RepID=A0A7W6J3Y1_9HYPH|nr:hypothetical protein [Gellertiella hungarica]